VDEETAVSDPDAPLVARIASGDGRALAELARRHTPRVRSLLLRFSGSAAEADDVLQETFWTVWRTAVRWRAGETPFAAFITRVAINKAIDRHRRRNLRRFFGLETAEAVADHAAGADQRVGDRQELAAVVADIHQSPPRQRAAILLCAGGERSNAEIAKALGLSEGAAEQLLVRARRTLRTKLALRDAMKEE
jgi:RNA polymerase sigma-70 factor (ECF subfamily)